MSTEFNTNLMSDKRAIHNTVHVMTIPDDYLAARFVPAALRFEGGFDSSDTTTLPPADLGGAGLADAGLAAGFAAGAFAAGLLADVFAAGLEADLGGALMEALGADLADEDKACLCFHWSPSFAPGELRPRGLPAVCSLPPPALV